MLKKSVAAILCLMMVVQFICNAQAQTQETTTPVYADAYLDAETVDGIYQLTERGFNYWFPTWVKLHPKLLDYVHRVYPTLTRASEFVRTFVEKEDKVFAQTDLPFLRFEHPEAEDLKVLVSGIPGLVEIKDYKFTDQDVEILKAYNTLNDVQHIFKYDRAFAYKLFNYQQSAEKLEFLAYVYDKIYRVNQAGRNSNPINSLENKDNPLFLAYRLYVHGENKEKGFTLAKLEELLKSKDNTTKTHAYAILRLPNSAVDISDEVFPKSNNKEQLYTQLNVDNLANELNRETDVPDYKTLLDYYYQLMQDAGKEDTVQFATDEKLLAPINPFSYELDIPDGHIVNLNGYLGVLRTYLKMVHEKHKLLEVYGPYILSDKLLYAQQQDVLRKLDALKKGSAQLEKYDAKKGYDFWNKEENSVSLKTLYDFITKRTMLVDFNSYDVSNLSSSFKYFFDEKSEEFSKEYMRGVALSAMFVPMQTNVYDPLVIQQAGDDDFINDFHYRWGFYRKALYLDTNPDAALELKRTGQQGTKRVVTLADLIKTERDVVLYADDNFYNANKLADYLKMDMNRFDNVDSESGNNGKLATAWEKFSNIFRKDIYNVTKTAEHKTYGFFPGITPYDPTKNPDQEDLLDIYDSDVVLPSKLIDEEMQKTDYTVLQPFAVVSGIYRTKDVLSKANAFATDPKPVFISSSKLAFVQNATQKDKESLLNYALLKNLEANMPLGYSQNLDMNSPLYLDIYGNILTESGLVVVPAAANPTLHSDGKFPIISTALYTTYGKQYKFPSRWNIAFDMFVKEGDFWELMPVNTFVGDTISSPSNSIGTVAMRKQMFNIYASDLQGNILDFDLHLNMILEVLRGAPIENIDKNFEGINTAGRLSKAGLIAASKLDELNNALRSKSVNTNLSIPNPAFIDGIEYIVFFFYKLMVLASVIIWMVLIYLDAVGGKLSLQTGLKCLSATLLTVLTIVVIPESFELSYYQANKALLQKEAIYIQMLNLEKTEEGREIGITGVTEPVISSKLYLKLDDVDNHWGEMFKEILLSTSVNSVGDAYKKYNENNPVTGEAGIDVFNDGVYTSLDSLLQSTTVVAAPSANTMSLYQSSNLNSLPVSFFSPYYTFLDILIDDVNKYNADNNVYAYGTKTQRGGELKTLGLVKAFFMSPQFAEHKSDDCLALGDIYGTTNGIVSYDNLLDPATVAKLRETQWVQRDIDTYKTNLENQGKTQENIDKLIRKQSEQLIKRIGLVNTHARDFVLEHFDLIGRVTDETFLKMMALDLALYHNKVFNSGTADTIEIYNLSNDDLLRLSIAPRTQVLLNSPLSFSRFVYETGRTPAIFAAALTVFITFVTGWLKPLLTLLIFAAVFVSVFVFKVILRKDNKPISGYLVTPLLVNLLNVLNAVLLKLSLSLPVLGLSPAICLLLSTVIQVFYVGALVMVVGVALHDWKSLGGNVYEYVASKMFDRTPTLSKGKKRHYKEGRDYLTELLLKQQKRVGTAFKMASKLKGILM
jgi:hypothetical protein